MKHHHVSTARVGLFVLLALALLVLGAALLPSAAVTRTAAGFEPVVPSGSGPTWLVPNAINKLYLPLVLNGGGSSLPPATATSTPVPPASTASGVFMNKSNKTTGPKIAVDAAGAVHLAYNAFNPEGTIYPAYYAYCAANCTSRANWGVVNLGVEASNVQMALTKAGHPRLLIYGHDPAYHLYYKYATCDSSCTNVANWKVAQAATTDFIDTDQWDYTLFNFALDNLDRPRFVHPKTMLGATAMYAFCDAPDCTAAGTWSEIQISYDADIFSRPSLTFTSDGKPRLATQIFTSQPGFVPSGYLDYGWCDLDCGNVANWWYATTYNDIRHFVLRLDSNNHPRIAAYQGTSGAGTLFYLACDNNCDVDTNWSKTNVGLPAGVGQVTDLALDSQNHPRLVYKRGVEGLGLAWCNTGCESSGSGWQNRLAEANSVLEAEWVPTIPSSCSTEYWYGGNRPSLALDTAGNLRVGTDAIQLATGTLYGCLSVIENYRVVRFTQLTHP